MEEMLKTYCVPFDEKKTSDSEATSSRFGLGSLLCGRFAFLTNGRTGRNWGLPTCRSVIHLNNDAIGIF